MAITTSQSFLLADCSTVANFKAYGTAVNTALTNFTWTKSGDTGQVNWANVSSVTQVGTTYYEVWVMTDTLQATNPVFMKVEYGYGAASANPAIAFTIGSGSNGTGTLINPGYRTVIGSFNASGGTSTTYECDFSGAANRFSMTLFRGYTYPSFFSVERSHTSTGGDTAGYATYLAAGNGFGTPYCFQHTLKPVSKGGGVVAYENGGLTVQTGNTTALYSNSIAVSPFWPLVGVMDYPLLGAVCIKMADFTDGATFSTTMYDGNPHTYLVSKPYSATAWGGQTNNAIAMRYE